MEDYEVKLEENKKRNEKYLKEFEEWLRKKNLVNKTINKHLDNVEFYLNEFLNYYDITKMEEGVHEVYSYLSGWFIEKCLWATKTSIKENASSIKKFYNCMSEKGYVSVDDYKSLCEDIKENMDEILDNLEAFDNGTYYDMFM